MDVYIVLYEHHKDGIVDVLDVYSDEERANRRVRFERSVIESNPETYFRNECWYQGREIIPPVQLNTNAIIKE
ncbi:hypothetical protein CIL05_07350 [Virgibacillus profundi]|uniref:Uncharacterized protein n=1 Tax=Virgibacillus profundi TaxID=2024555 RepID=A0A2A2IG32_9BACI|nr:hypothetical protein [Virgibacillus profundi]PAV30276.1 hypothetical protein CIL05_07350 [Virgibacillus profundi]PXY54448.1 hypothetical protein CIT14_07435 [Virgibacillus profundi]